MRGPGEKGDKGWTGFKGETGPNGPQVKQIFSDFHSKGVDGFLSLVSAATLSQVLEQIRFNPFFKCSCLRETRLLTDCFVYSKGDQGAPGVEGSDGPPGLRVSTFARQNLARTPFTF